MVSLQLQGVYGIFQLDRCDCYCPSVYHWRFRIVDCCHYRNKQDGLLQDTGFKDLLQWVSNRVSSSAHKKRVLSELCGKVLVAVLYVSIPGSAAVGSSRTSSC